MSSAPHPKCQMVLEISLTGGVFTFWNSIQLFCAQTASNNPANLAGWASNLVV